MLYRLKDGSLDKWDGEKKERREGDEGDDAHIGGGGKIKKKKKGHCGAAELRCVP